MIAGKPKHENVVLGMAFGYSWPQLRPFVKSLRKTGYKEDVVLFVKNMEDRYTIKKLYEHNVKVIAVPTPPRDACIAMLRNYLYQEYLSKIKYNKVMITDVSDVIFQSNPFEEVKEGIYFFLEDANITIGICPYNSAWIKEAYGNEYFELKKDKPISCAGTIIGTYDDVMDYLDMMTQEIDKFNPASNLDQAAHNYIIWENYLDNFSVFPNDAGLVMTIGYMQIDSLEFENGLLKNKYGYPAVIHQYNRQQDLFDVAWRFLDDENNSND